MADLFNDEPDEPEDDRHEPGGPDCPLGAVAWIGRIRADANLVRHLPRP